MIIIDKINAYATFTKEGGYRVIQDGACIYSTTDYDDKFVRRRRLPRWCRRKIKKGFEIEVEEFVLKGTSLKDFYLEVHGRVIKSNKNNN